MPTFLDCIEEGLTFAEPVADFQHSRNAPLICFVVNNQEITHIALGRRGVRAGTGLRRLNFVKAEKLPKPIPLYRIFDLLPKRNLASVESRFNSGGLLTEKGFVAVVDAIRQLAPQSNLILERYSGERIEHIRRLTSKARENLAYQKEAVLTALSIADMDRSLIQEWTALDDTPVSFLDGLPNTRLREDPMVIHDLNHLPGFDIIKTYPFAAVVFKSDSEHLTVILANRLPLEEQTGTDLIYFNETFQSFIMVQYKAMEHEKDNTGTDRFIYRIPNKQLEEEINRMEILLEKLKECSANTEHGGFRLTENPFFLKLCPRLVFKPDDISLTPGMYIPLNYWKLLEQHPCIKGSRGGVGVTYQNVDTVLLGSCQALKRFFFALMRV